MEAEAPQGREGALIGRLAGGAALGVFAVFVVSLFLGPANVLHSNPAAPSALAYAAANRQLIWVFGFLDGLLNTVFGILVLLLLALTGDRGIVARIAAVSTAAAVALQWAHAGMLYALAELAHRGGADAGVLALFTLGATMDNSDSVPIGLALGCLGVLLLRSQALPAPLVWFTLLMAVVNALSTPAVIAGAGFADPLSVLLSLVWSLAIGITLLIKPVWGRRDEPGGARSAT